MNAYVSRKERERERGFECDIEKFYELISPHSFLQKPKPTYPQPHIPFPSLPLFLAEESRLIVLEPREKRKRKNIQLQIYHLKAMMI